MPPAYWCLLIGALLPYATVGVAKLGKNSGFDNARPRESEAAMTGLRARALGAHNNGFEAFPMFAVAVLIAGQLGFAGPMLDRLAMVWVVLRVAYILFYLADKPSLRSATWGLGTAITIAIFTLPAWG